MSEILSTSLWILEHKSVHNMKVRMMVMELPKHHILNAIDMSGLFMPAIVEQTVQIIQSLRGQIQPNTAFNLRLVNKFPEFSTDDDDMLILHFQKHYSGSTQNSVISLNDFSENKEKLFSNNIETNKLLKDSEFILKYNIKINLSSTFLEMSVVGTGEKDFTETEVQKIKSTMM